MLIAFYFSNIDSKDLIQHGALRIQEHQTLLMLQNRHSGEIEEDNSDSILNGAFVFTETARDLCVVASDLLSMSCHPSFLIMMVLSHICVCAVACCCVTVAVGRVYRLYMSQMKIKESAVNWGAIARMSKEFKKFVEATAELQKVTTTTTTTTLSYPLPSSVAHIYMSRDLFLFMVQVDLTHICYPGRLTFWLNIYHTMVLHLHIIMGGSPTNLFLRRAFFHHYQYKIGKFTYSLNDIQHGILRGTTSIAQRTEFHNLYGCDV